MESPNESDSDTTASHGMHGDIAVVGLSCRLAGGIENPEDFWKALLEKQVKSGQIPAIRWEAYRRRDARNAKACFPRAELFLLLLIIRRLGTEQYYQEWLLRRKYRAL